MSYLQSPPSQVSRRVLDNGTIEETHTLPKNQYYASLRNGSQYSLARNSGSTYGLSARYDSMQRSKSHSNVYKPSGKMNEATVILLDGTEQVFRIDSNSNGLQLMDEVCNHLDLVEKAYFGIRYHDKSLRIWFWLKMDKKISDQVQKNGWNFEFQVKFYPPHEENIVEDLTRYLFCLQIRQDIIQGIIPASFNILVLLGAYAVQSEAGDYDPREHIGIEYLKQLPFAPKPLETDEMLKRIRDLHETLSYLNPEEADRFFMWNAMKLAMYGVDMHRVKTNKNEEVSVGVYHGGVVIYKGRIRNIKHSWVKLMNVAYKNKTFILKLRPTEFNKKETTLEFKCGHQKLAKRLYLACREHHAFFRMYDAENPKKPQLLGFGTRKYRQPASPSSDLGSLSTPTTPNIILQRPQPKVRRTQTQRRENETPMSPSGPAPVANNDEFFHGDDDGHGKKAYGPRPQMIDEYWKMTPHDATVDLGIDPDGFDIAAKEGAGWQGCRANRGIKGPGKYYYEGKVLEDGLVRLGWSLNDGSLNLGSDGKGYGYGDNNEGDRTSGSGAWKQTENKEEEYGEAVHEGDIIGCMVDFDNGAMQWNKNGINYGPAFHIPSDQKNEAFFPTSSVKDGRVIFNFGDEPMEHLPSKSGYQPLNQSLSPNIIPNENCGWRMNPFDATKNTEVSGNGAEIQSTRNGEWNGCRANKGVFDAGKYYYEVVPAEDGLARVGWATEQGSLNLGSDPLGYGYGADEDGFGISGNQGKKLHNTDIDNYGQGYGKGDVIGCFLDLDKKQIKWSKNGNIFEEAYEVPDELITYSAFYPTASLLDNTLDFNFGERPFQFYPGSEWMPVCYAARGNTDNTKKIDPSLYRRPHTDRHEDILEKRRQDRDKMRRTKAEKERIERNERERRLAQQKHEEEMRAKHALEEEERRRMLLMRQQQEEEDLTRLRRQQQEQEEMRRRQKELEETEDRREIVEEGDPEVTTETYIDELGRTVMRTVKKRKTKTITSVHKNVIERSEDEVNRTNNNFRITAKKSTNNQELDYDDYDLINAILFVSGFDIDTNVKNLNELSMSTN